MRSTALLLHSLLFFPLFLFRSLFCALSLSLFLLLNFLPKDILNNLDNLESCDLDEDDLMLDVDLPEESSLHSGE